MAIGNVQLMRYFSSPAGAPIERSGHGLTVRAWCVFMSKRSIAPA